MILRKRWVKLILVTLQHPFQVVKYCSNRMAIGVSERWDKVGGIERLGVIKIGPKCIKFGQFAGDLGFFGKTTRCFSELIFETLYKIGCAAEACLQRHFGNRSSLLLEEISGPLQANRLYELIGRLVY